MIEPKDALVYSGDDEVTSFTDHLEFKKNKNSSTKCFKSVFDSIDEKMCGLETGEVIVGDVKSTRTIKLPMYRRNKKHLFAQYGINITEIL